MFKVACSKRSDSGERFGVEKAMKSRGGLDAFIDSQLMSLFGHRSKKITPVEHSTLLQAFHTNIFGTLKNPSPGFYSRSLCYVKSKDCKIVQRLNPIGFFLKERALD